LNTPILEIKNAGYVVGSTTILDNISWRVDQGDHWVVLGPNGAGKTTLLRMACGYIWPNSGGEVLRQGKRLLDLRELRRSIGWVSHRLAAAIPANERVHDTVVSGRVGQIGLKASLHGPRPRPEDYENAAKFLADLGCTHLVERRFGVLSQGEQQKVLIARALMAFPLLIFLDEPCAGLDPGARERFLASLRKLAGRGGVPSLVLVTHHIEEIMPAFGKLLAMNDARIVAQGLTEEIISPELIASLYSQPVHDLIRFDGRMWPVF
jgi:iron complex transport system ATP-binding protein